MSDPNSNSVVVWGDVLQQLQGHHSVNPALKPTSSALKCKSSFRSHFSGNLKCPMTVKYFNVCTPPCFKAHDLSAK